MGSETVQKGEGFSKTNKDHSGSSKWFLDYGTPLGTFSPQMGIRTTQKCYSNGVNSPEECIKNLIRMAGATQTCVNGVSLPWMISFFHRRCPTTGDLMTYLERFGCSDHASLSLSAQPNCSRQKWHFWKMGNQFSVQKHKKIP